MASRRRRRHIVTVDGEIGAGKTTLIELLRAALAARGLEVAVVPEPVEAWERSGKLREFYSGGSDAERLAAAAYDFQTHVIATRVGEAQAVSAASPGADVYLLERSIYTDRHVFMELQRELVGPARMAAYGRWWAAWAAVMPFSFEPDKVTAVYLKPSLGACQARVEARARSSEVASGGVSAEYQARLRRAHEAYLEPAGAPRPFATPVVLVDGPLADGDFSSPGAPARRVVAHVVEKLLERWRQLEPQ